MHLFGKNHVGFNECCYDAQKFDDNCDFGQLKKTTSSYASPNKLGNSLEPNAIVDAIIRKMRLESRNEVPNRLYPLRQYSCGACGGNHPMERGPTTNILKWCDICRRMTNH